MAEDGVTLNPKKCEFPKREIKFLVHVVGDSGVRADPQKVEAITNMLQPKNLSQLRSYLSSISFLQQ